jgi:RNA polymerase sigma factor (sigma-70 family)
MSDDFVHLYQAHVADVYGYLAYRLGSRAAAEALTRETFERVFEQRTAFDYDPERARTSLIRIARDASSGRAAARRSDGDDPGIEEDLAIALEQLGREERTVVALRFGAGLNGHEIARVLELSERRVRRVLSRGLRRLRTELERRQRSGPSGAGKGSVPAGLARRDQDRDDDERGEAQSQQQRG